jgi:pteridine reductase
LNKADYSREIAVVTGAAVRLGREIVLALASRGYTIGLHYYRSEDQALETAAQLDRAGGSTILLPADLRDPEQITSMFQTIAESPYRLSVLVNSAANMTRGNLRNLSIADWDTTMDLNLRAPWLCSRAAAELMDTEGGLIVNMSDTGASKVWTGFPAYEVSKAGLEMLTRLLARNYAPKIRVNAIAPGLIMKADEMEENEWEHLVEKIPLKTSGSSEAIVKAILFLIDSQYITGETLVIDGGYRLI